MINANNHCKLWKKCKNKSDSKIVKCSGCKVHWIHEECFMTMCLKFNTDSSNPITINPVCSKRCWNQAIKPTIDETEDCKRRFWHNDGPTENVNSLSVLLEWLTYEGNYAKWKGSSKHSGLTKNTLAGQILVQMKSRGITVERTAKDIIQKISIMDQNFKKAVDFLDGTGAGITNEESLAAAVKKICPYYYELEMVMSDWQSTRPLASANDIDYSESNISEESNDNDDNNNVNEQLCEQQNNIQQTIMQTVSNSSKRSSSHLSIRSKTNKKTGGHFDMSELAFLKREQLALDKEHKAIQVKHMDVNRTLKEREIEAQEKEADAREKEANARQKEADAREKEADTRAKEAESNIKIAFIEAKCKLLLKRKELLDNGVSQAEIDDMLSHLQ